MFYHHNQKLVLDQSIVTGYVATVKAVIASFQGVGFDSHDGNGHFLLYGGVDMLVLSRRSGEKVIIGDAITLTVLAISRDRVRVGIDAPDHVRILRAELAGWEHDSSGSDKMLGPDSEANPECSEVASFGQVQIHSI
jgi:carbon storage regulator CsrA